MIVILDTVQVYLWFVLKKLCGFEFKYCIMTAIKR